MQNQELVIELKQEPFPHAIIRNFYNEKELSCIWKELDFYTSPLKLIDATNMGAAKDKTTNLSLAKHRGIHLDEIYRNNRHLSDILTSNRKAFNVEILDALSTLSPLICDIKYVNYDTTKIKYYEHNEDYKSHWDTARFTMVTYLYKEPKAFTGGDLCFEDFNYTIPIENNMMVFFTGCINHTSTKINMTDYIDENCSGHGKYTITQFLNVIDNHD